MKTLLIYPPIESVYGLPRHPTMGITYLATVLYGKGFPVEVLDMRFPKYNLQFLKQRLISFQPDVVGVGSTSFDFPAAIKVFNTVKRFSPKIITILGGPHASICPTKVMEEKTIDYLMIGEGEREFLKFVLRKPPTEIKGLVLRKKQKVVFGASPELIKDLDSIPFPRWDLYPLDDYKVRGKLTLPLLTSRGCPYGCIYCVSWKTHGKIFRKRSSKNVVDEIENDIQRYGTRNFSILDDNFSFDKQRALAICQEIIKRKLKINWICSQGIRADNSDKKLFRAMRKSGCSLIALGVEAADQEVLDLMKKGEKLEMIRQAIVDAKAVGLIVKAFFIVGGPGDNLGKTKQSIRFFKETGVDIPRFGMMTAYPGSPLWEWVEKNGRFINDPYKYILETPTTARGVQFDTKDFPKKKRLEAFTLAEKEAEIWAIRQRLIKLFGPLFGKVFLVPFYLAFFRGLVKKIYRLRIFSVVD